MNQHHKKRVVVLIDMDCFYVQVEQRRDPLIRGKPCAVVQYNAWKGGGIIAVGYEARAVGVSRNMRGDEAKQKCPEIHLCRVPTANGKADLTRYRDASAEVIKVLLQFGGLVERASIDEAYVDVTETIDKILEKSSRTFDSVPKMDDLQFTHVVGYPGVETCDDSTDERSMGLQVYMQQLEGSGETNVADARLLIAAKIVEDMRQAVYDQTSFRCSAGISYNKMLAKLACGINKPNKQTILPRQSVAGLFETIKIGKIRNLGGKLGKSLMSIYGVKYIGELTKLPSNLLVEEFGAKTGLWLHEVCRGIDNEIVKERHLAESVGCSKNFTGVAALNTRTKVKHWIEQLAKELVERLIKERDLNNRLAKGMTAHVGLQGRRPVSRVCPLDRYDVGQVTIDCLSTIEKLNESSNKKSDVWTPAITMMGISSKNFRPVNGNDLTTMANKMKTCQKKTNAAPTLTVQIPTTTIVSGTTENEETTDTGNCKDAGGVSRFFKSSTSNVNNNSLSTSNGKSKKRSSFEAFFTSPSDDGSSSQEKSSKIDQAEIQADKMFQRFKESGESKSKRKENEEKSTDSGDTSERSRSFLSKFAFLNEIETSQPMTTKSHVTAASRLKVEKSNDGQRSVVEYNHSFDSLKKPTDNELATSFPEKSKVVHHNEESPQMTGIDQKQLCKIDCARQRQEMKQQQNQSFPVTNGSSSKKVKMFQSSSNKSNIPTASSQDKTFYHQHPGKDDIDMAVFDSLPLGIQHELRSALGMQSSQNSNKKSDVNSGQQQNSIQKFLTPGTSFKSSSSSTKSTFSQQPMNAKKQKPRGGDIPSKSRQSPGLPCGFFRARFQTSAAIKKAVEAQKLRSEKNDGKSKK